MLSLEMMQTPKRMRARRSRTARDVRVRVACTNACRGSPRHRFDGGYRSDAFDQQTEEDSITRPRRHRDHGGALPPAGLHGGGGARYYRDSCSRRIRRTRAFATNRTLERGGRTSLSVAAVSSEVSRGSAVSGMQRGKFGRLAHFRAPREPACTAPSSEEESANGGEATADDGGDDAARRQRMTSRRRRGASRSRWRHVRRQRG